MDLSPEVVAALARGDAVVALESTLICHGIPRPRNLELALAVENAVRAEGAVPATIAVLDGRLRVGLDQAELRALAMADGVVKCSTRDLAWVMAAGLTGATTVAGTIYVAARAGLRVMATGGLGGVHRAGELSLDVSADLPELARSPVAVVCSGAKSILDLPRTVETLETLGVPVVTRGSAEFPAFFTRTSGYASPLQVDTVEEISALVDAHWSLGGDGLVLANPIPVEDEIDATTIGVLIDRALADADAAGVTGKAITPYLLGRIVELSDGDSLRANIALVRHNAAFGAALAGALSGRD